MKTASFKLCRNILIRVHNYKDLQRYDIRWEMLDRMT